MKKILLTGGGTGGHIFPLVSVGKKIKEIGRGDVDVEYIGPESRWAEYVSKNEIKTHKITAAKIRRYFDFQNIIDIPKFIYSIFEALFKVYFIMPDVLFSKGGPGSLPVVIAAKFYMIPIIIHESDSVPSLTTKITSKFAKRIGISFESTAKYLPESKTFMSGNPVRREFLKESSMQPNQAKSYLSFNPEEPLIIVMGGSQGSKRINDLIINNLDRLVSDFQIFHIVGEDNFNEIKSTVDTLYKNWDEEKRKRYRYESFISAKDMAIAMNGADIMISRSGSGTIFESAATGLPAILVPLEESANNHQKINAHKYAETGAAIVIEENNFTLNILTSRIKDVLQNPQKIEKMKKSAKSFSKAQASNIIAKEIFNL